MSRETTTDNAHIRLRLRDMWQLIATLIGITAWLTWFLMRVFNQVLEANEKDHRSLREFVRATEIWQKSCWTVGDMQVLYSDITIWTNYWDRDIIKRQQLIKDIHSANLSP